MTKDYYALMIGKHCCDKCHDVYFEKNYPAHIAHDCCRNQTCICHKGISEIPGTAECGFDCHFQEPYGFVPEAGCTIHDNKKTPQYACPSYYNDGGLQNCKCGKCI